MVICGITLFLISSVVASSVIPKTSTILGDIKIVESITAETADVLTSQMMGKELNNDEKKNTLENPKGYKSRFLPIYIRDNGALRGLRGRIHGVVGGRGTEEDPYVIAG
jgi:hypothetical protein